MSGEATSSLMLGSSLLGGVIYGGVALCLGFAQGRRCESVRKSSNRVTIALVIASGSTKGMSKKTMYVVVNLCDWP